jgi:hypothetical protein
MLTLFLIKDCLTATFSTPMLLAMNILLRQDLNIPDNATAGRAVLIGEDWSLTRDFAGRESRLRCCEWALAKVGDRTVATSKAEEFFDTHGNN